MNEWVRSKKQHLLQVSCGLVGDWTGKSNGVCLGILPFLIYKLASMQGNSIQQYTGSVFPTGSTLSYQIFVLVLF